MKTTVTITEKRSGNLFIGKPNANGQKVVATIQSPAQAVKFFKNNLKKVIKATYSQSQTYYCQSELPSNLFWEEYFENQNFKNAEFAILNLAKKVREKAKDISRKNIENETISAFSEDVKARFLAKWNEISGGKNFISNKEANQLAWKKQNYLRIEKVDIVTLRSLLKSAINK